MKREDNFDQRIEDARDKYCLNLLNEKFENPEDNRIRREKLNKLSEIIFLDGLQELKSKKSKI